MKALVSVAPSAVVIFVSDLYAGSKYDKHIVQNCGLLKYLEAKKTC